MISRNIIFVCQVRSLQYQEADLLPMFHNFLARKTQTSGKHYDENAGGGPMLLH